MSTADSAAGEPRRTHARGEFPADLEAEFATLIAAMQTPEAEEALLSALQSRPRIVINLAKDIKRGSPTSE